MSDSSPAERLALAALLAASVAALAIASRPLGPTAWSVGLLMLAALLARPLRVHPWSVRRLPTLANWLVAALVVFGAAWTLYPVLPEALVRRFPLALGGALAALGAALLAGTSVWPPHRALLPVCFGLLVAAAFDPRARIGAPLMAAWVSALAYLIAGQREGGGRAWRRVARAAGFVLAGAALALGILRLLPWAQPKVEAVAARMLTDDTQGYAGLSKISRLGSIEALALSTRPVLRVFTPRAQKLRARALTRFDGVTWSGFRRPVRALEPVEAGAQPREWLERIPGRLLAVPGAPAGAGVPSRMAVVSAGDGLLVAPRHLSRLRIAADSARIDDLGVLEPAPAGVSGYGTVNHPDALDEAPCLECLDVPKDTDARIRELAARIGSGAATPEARLLATTGWLDRECEYALQVGAFRTRQPVAEFLFEKKRGYCEYFASAAAVLLRLQGVPTRYVTGFNVTESSRRAGHYLVREADAHAWIEALLPGRGWVEVDPTPASEYEALHAGLGGGLIAEAWENLAAWLAEAPARALADLALRPESLAALAAIGAVVVARRRRRRSPRRALARGPAAEVPPEVAVLLARVDAACARRGFARPAARGALEHLAWLPQGGVPPEMREAARAAVEAYYRARFGGVALAPEELAMLRTGLDRTEA
jgi:transglutaminase-like putative cysteine protease